MNFPRILELAKKNIFSIVCALIAIAGIIATFWPLGGMLEQLKTLADSRASIYTQLDGVYNQPRKLPLTDPSKTQQDDLTQFPNPKIIAQGTEATGAIHDQSKKMVDLVVALNSKSHAPLVDQVLPVAVSATQKYHFGDVYRLVLSVDPNDSINTNPKLKEANQRNLRNDIMNGGIPPADADIRAAQKDLWDNQFGPRVISRNGQPINLVQIQNEYNQASAKLPDSMKTDIALKKKVYVSADAFTVNSSVIQVNEPLPVDIWFSQVTLWVQQDVAEAIAETNSNAKNILDAPVKQLIKLTIPLTPTPYTGITVVSPGAAPPTPPVAVEGGDAVAVPKLLQVSPTGRISNAMYDVVQFTLVVNVDASQISTFIQTLGQNRLIDVYNIAESSVDLFDARQAGYIYGTMPVVKLTLNCEALFLRQWTAPLMPDAVKKLMNIAPTSTAQASAQ